jgi:hypothetical protein
MRQAYRQAYEERDAVSGAYVHGYHRRENDRLRDQAGTLVVILRGWSFFVVQIASYRAVGQIAILEQLGSVSQGFRHCECEHSEHNPNNENNRTEDSMPECVAHQ